MSDTPITDRNKRSMDGYADEWVPRYVAETLERELGNVRHHLLNMCNDNAGLHSLDTPELVRKVFRELWEDRTQYLRQVEKLRTAAMDLLFRYQNRGLISQLGGGSMASVIARMEKALEETKPDFER